MIAAAFCLAYCGLSGLAASQTHRKRDIPHVVATRIPSWLLRIFGTLALLASLWVCLSIWPIDEGIVAWVLVAAASGIAVVGVLSLAPGGFWWFLSLAAIAGGAALGL